MTTIPLWRCEVHNTQNSDACPKCDDELIALTEATRKEERDAEMRAWYVARRNVTYTDGSPVQPGDLIRYHQAPGGLLPHGDWRYGEAVSQPLQFHEGLTEMVLRDADGRLYNLYGHVIKQARCACAEHNDGSVTTFLCSVHADTDPCLTMAITTGRRRTGTIRRGVCTHCGHRS